MKESFGPLYQPLTLPNGVHLVNRFVLSPMVTNSSTADGFVTKDDLLYASRRAGSALYKFQGQPILTLMDSYLNMVLVSPKMLTFLA